MGQAALKIEPDGEWLSESEIAKRCGIHRQTAAARIDDLGYEPDEELSNAKKKVYWFDDEMEHAIKSAKDTSTAVRIRKDRADAMTKEFNLAKLRGEYIQIADAIERMQTVLTAMYKEFGVHQPKRLASRLAKAKTVAEISKILKADNDKIFARLREKDVDFVPQTKK
jgi:hypothetical protein